MDNDETREDETVRRQRLYRRDRCKRDNARSSKPDRVCVLGEGTVPCKPLQAFT